MTQQDQLRMAFEHLDQARCMLRSVVETGGLSWDEYGTLSEKTAAVLNAAIPRKVPHEGK